MRKPLNGLSLYRSIITYHHFGMLASSDDNIFSPYYFMIKLFYDQPFYEQIIL